MSAYDMTVIGVALAVMGVVSALIGGYVGFYLGVYYVNLKNGALNAGQQPESESQS